MKFKYTVINCNLNLDVIVMFDHLTEEMKFPLNSYLTGIEVFL